MRMVMPMVARRSSNRSKSDTPTEVSIFGPAPILDGEDSKAYDALLARVSGDVTASDIFEEIWVRDVVDLTWEILRYRRVKASLIICQMEEALADSISTFVDLPAEDEFSDQTEPEEDEDPSEPEDDKDCITPSELAAAWASHDPVAIKQANELLASAGRTMDSVIALAFERELHNIERIERLLTVAEARRNATLRDIDRHRATLARTLRDKLADAEDAEFEIVGPSKTIEPIRLASKHAA
jgi:hypothetical protein